MRSFYLSGETAVRRSSLFLALAAAAAGLTLHASGAARADRPAVTYRTAPLVMSGDRFGDLQIPANDDLFVGGLTDAGQIIFSAGNVQGSRPEMLLQWDGKTLTPIVAPASGPVGAYSGDIYWTHDVIIDRPVSVNDRGNVAFTADHVDGNNFWGTFLWDAGKQKVVPIALKQMPATGELVFVKPGSFGVAINNTDEIALAGWVKGPNGPNGWGLFYHGRDGILRTVLLPGQSIPAAGGRARAVTDPFFRPSLNNGGAIAFLARTQGSGRYGAYVWEDGEIAPILLGGQALPGGAKVTQITSVSLNRDDRNVVVTASTDQAGSGRYGLYRVLHGKITPIAVPGTPLPGGGTLKTIQYTYPREDSLPTMGVSSLNATGQQVFLGTLNDGSTGAYLVDPDGTMTRVYQTVPAGTVHIASATDLLQIVPSSRPVLNNRGQIALSARTTNGRSLIMLLTPNR